MYPATSSRTNWRPWIAAGILISAAVWGWLSFGQRIEWSRISQAFRSIDLAWFSLACGIAVLTYVGRAFRWAVLLEPDRPEPNLGQLISATVIGYAAIVIFGRPGELVRPYLIARGQGVSIASQMAAWLTERVWDLLMALVIFGFALKALDRTALVVPPRLATVIEGSGTAVLGLTAASFAVLLGFRWFAPLLLRVATLLEGQWPAAGRFAATFLTSMAAANSPVRALKLFAWSVAEWAAILISCLALFRSVQSTWAATPLDITIFVGFITFGGIVQLPGVGGGTQVVGTIILHELFGLPLESALVLAWLTWLSTFVVIVPVGLIAAMREGLSWSSVRRLADTTKEELKGV